MATLPWNKAIMDWFVDIRVDWLTQIFVAITFLGNEMGYILLIASIYWLYNRRMALQLVIAVIITSTVNHTLKILIRNPRPFVVEGTYEENWAIPAGDIEDTLHSFSTPSGHAQGASTFWLYLHLKAQSRVTFVLFPIMILLIGLSRPYLGVHYLEDIIIGWIVGIIIVVILHRYDNKVAVWWSDRTGTVKVLITVVPSFILSIIAGLLSGYTSDGSSYVTLFGIFAGVIIGALLDDKYLSFTPDLSSYGSIVSKVLVGIGRMILGLILVGIVLIGLDELFAALSPDETLLGFLFRWTRYSLVSIMAIFGAPFLFSKVGLAKQIEEQ